MPLVHSNVCVLRPSVGVALLCSFLLGLGDSCFNTQLLSIIGFTFRDNSAPAFAVFKFIQVNRKCVRGYLDWKFHFKFHSRNVNEIVISSPPQSIMAALAFFYSNYLLLHWQLLILVLVGFLGSMTFFLAEWVAESSRRESDYESI